MFLKTCLFGHEGAHRQAITRASLNHAFVWVMGAALFYESVGHDSSVLCQSCICQWGLLICRVLCRAVLCVYAVLWG